MLATLQSALAYTVFTAIAVFYALTIPVLAHSIAFSLRLVGHPEAHKSSLRWSVPLDVVATVWLWWVFFAVM